MSLEVCRSMYPACVRAPAGLGSSLGPPTLGVNQSAALLNVTTANGTREYSAWCPCFDRNTRSNAIAAPYMAPIYQRPTPTDADIQQLQQDCIAARGDWAWTCFTQLAQRHLCETADGSSGVLEGNQCWSKEPKDVHSTWPRAYVVDIDSHTSPMQNSGGLFPASNHSTNATLNSTDNLPPLFPAGPDVGATGPSSSPGQRPSSPMTPAPAGSMEPVINVSDFNAAQYANTMTMSALVNVSGAVQTNGSLVAIEQTVDTIRGVQNIPSFPPFGTYADQAIFLITLYGEGGHSNDTLRFVFVSGVDQQVAYLQETVSFVVNDNLGSVLAPIVLTGTFEGHGSSNGGGDGSFGGATTGASPSDSILAPAPQSGVGTGLSPSGSSGVPNTFAPSSQPQVPLYGPSPSEAAEDVVEISFSTSGSNYRVSSTDSGVTITGTNNPSIEACSGTFLFKRSDTGHPLRFDIAGWSQDVTSSNNVEIAVEAGTYTYVCTSHSTMTGSFTVTDCGTPLAQGSSPSSTGDATNTPGPSPSPLSFGDGTNPSPTGLLPHQGASPSGSSGVPNTFAPSSQPQVPLYGPSPSEAAEDVVEISFSTSGSNYRVSSTDSGVTITGTNNPSIEACSGTFLFKRSDTGHPLRFDIAGWSQDVTSSNNVEIAVEAGTYTYVCTSHSTMTGSFTVTDC